MKKRAQKLTNRQLAFLVDYMMGHSEFAAGRFMGATGKTNLTNQWARLTDELNSLGPPRTVDKWIKVTFSPYFSFFLKKKLN